MALTDEQRQTLIRLKVGDTGGVLLANLPLLWIKWEMLADWPGLHDLYATIDAIDLVLGAVRAGVDFKQEGNLDAKLHQRVTALMGMRASAIADIEREMRYLEGRVPLIGQIDSPSVLGYPLVPRVVQR